MPEIQYTDEEVRVLGALLEKQMTTPEYYPMSVNGLKNACNQKSNRHPRVAYEEGEVLSTLDALRRKALVLIVSGSGSRVRKYEHRLKEVLCLSRGEMAVLCVLMLRGPQTIGELRSRTERMMGFEHLAEVESVLDDLSAAGRQPQPLVVQLPRLPGQKDSRYAHLLAGEIDFEALKTEAEAATAAGQAAPPDTARLDVLSETVTELQMELAALRTAFQEFKKQFE